MHNETMTTFMSSNTLVISWSYMTFRFIIILWHFENASEVVGVRQDGQPFYDKSYIKFCPSQLGQAI